MTDKAWSHSAPKSFEDCPKRYYTTKVSKQFTEQMGEAVTWGKEVHSAIERHLARGTSFPEGMAKVHQAVKPFVLDGVDKLVEQQMALTKDFVSTGWFDRDVWVRCTIDLALLNNDKAVLIDWKTGKRSEEDDQLALMAAVMFAIYPDLNTIDSCFVWLKEEPGSQISRVTFDRSELPLIWDRFLRRVAVYQEAHDKTEFPPAPGRLCRKWCPVTSCPHHGT